MSAAKDAVEKAMNDLADGLAKGASDKLIQWVKVVGKFHKYSLFNQLMIAMQQPGASFVAGFHAWKKFGRHVKKGGKGIGILAPMLGKKTKKDASTGEEKTVAQCFGFKIVYVFDISQTEGKDLPTIGETTCGHDLTNDFSKLESVIGSMGINITYRTIGGGCLGLSSGGNIEIEESLSSAEKFGVLVHEFAHELLHQNGGERPDKTTRELEAEAVSLAVCSAFGIDRAEHSENYLRLYSADRALLVARLERIRNTANQILDLMSAKTCETVEA